MFGYRIARLLFVLAFTKSFYNEKRPPQFEDVTCSASLKMVNMDMQTEMPVNTTVGTTLLDEELRRILQERELECLQLQAMNSTPPPEPYCRMTFDGWSCWPNTPAGTTVYAPCPNFITGFDASLQAHKYCESNGTWFRHPESDQVWSNYTTCVNLQDLSWQQGISGLYEAGYAISLVALLLSLGILTYFRSLRCARTTLHMNLFASFAVNNALWLVWYRCIVANTDLLLNNEITCRLLHIILHYFLLTNYAWMLCEGFYLHTLLVSAFTSEHKLVKWLMGLGWPVPAVIVTIYASLRATSDDPADTGQATLLLVPLLGLHYLVIPFRPPKNHPWEQFYEVLSAITASFQGLCVAVLFCFCNGEVIAQFKRRWEGTALLRNRANSCTATTVSVRCRERRRCDYRSSVLEVPDEKRAVDDRQQIVQLVAATPVPNSHNNHARMLIKSNELSDYDQTQC
ncbi:calcitonin gene-related peptide type 1 receptor-like isoform X7 [Bombus pyrosoma]|uniref:calcitonin gene-related peptide type 1 receptor-like isoform X7 n=1 Tax=Bombus pyrosoma TaxID=396416 RepID=UPI001CB9B676|nr:calcitonin gene-related peptide type 1 receptor-like isoform X7 [Bombus pyrosoma]